MEDQFGVQNRQIWVYHKWLVNTDQFERNKFCLQKVKNLRAIIERVHSVRAIGSAALNLCHVAEGSCDAYFEYGIHCWDIAAGELICREAGAYVCDPTGDPLNIMNRRILATASKELSAQIIPLLTHIDMPSD